MEMQRLNEIKRENLRLGRSINNIQVRDTDSMMSSRSSKSSKSQKPVSLHIHVKRMEQQRISIEN
jgi:hypothetical protein